MPPQIPPPLPTLLSLLRRRPQRPLSSAFPHPNTTASPSLQSPTQQLHKPHHQQQQLRTLIAAPKPNSGPLLTRRSDRALPTIAQSRRWLLTLPLFALITGGATLAIFNYQKASSSVVSSTLYALRTSPRARAELGDEVYFNSNYPWIRGEINQLHGRINIRFGVKGTKGKGTIWFKSERRRRGGFFETSCWELVMEDGRVVNLLAAGEGDGEGVSSGPAVEA